MPSGRKALAALPKSVGDGGYAGGEDAELLNAMLAVDAAEADDGKRDKGTAVCK